MWYYYVSPTVVRVRPTPERFVLANQLHTHRGFRSVYAYDHATVTQFCRLKTLRTLPNMMVFSDLLVVDFDNCETQAHAFVCALQQRNLTYEVYASGNRSLHVEVPTLPLVGAAVPRTHKQFVSTHAPGADLSIYNPVGMYRLALTWHERNPGHCKQLVDKHQGLTLDLPLASVTTKSIDDIKRTVSPTLLELALNDTVTEGGRRSHIWRIATRCYDLGYDINTALQYAFEWNLKNAIPPLDMYMVEQKVHEAYKQRDGGRNVLL